MYSDSFNRITYCYLFAYTYTQYWNWWCIGMTEVNLLGLRRTYLLFHANQFQFKYSPVFSLQIQSICTLVVHMYGVLYPLRCSVCRVYQNFRVCICFSNTRCCTVHLFAFRVPSVVVLVLSWYFRSTFQSRAIIFTFFIIIFSVLIGSKWKKKWVSI